MKIENYEEPKPSSENQNLVSIQEADLCNRFTARIIRNVKIAPSPDWLVKRLEAVGERSINNVADITNFVMHEVGQPMHAFDLNKLNGNRIVVRRARNGETIKTLDEVERKLNSSMLAICDAEKPVAVAGVMGGFDSSITEGTTDVLLEVAYFDRANIRQTSRDLKLLTEASHRFERGVDIENLLRASDCAKRLICSVAGGEAEEFVDIYPVKYEPVEIESSDIQKAVKRLTGLDVKFPKILVILTSLGFAVKNLSKKVIYSPDRRNSLLMLDNVLSEDDADVFFDNPESRHLFFSVPSWRHDISIEEDLVEEVARVVGYDNIADELTASSSAGEFQPTETRKKNLRKTLVDLGFDEAISYSFIDAKTDEKFDFVPDLVRENLGEKFITLQDSIVEGAVRMRPSLLSGLLDAVRTNFNQQRKDLKLFEIGKVFSASAKENDLPEERELFALVVTGGETLENRAMTRRELDFYDAKGALEVVAASINLSGLEFQAAEAKHLRKGQSAQVKLNEKIVGTIGRISDDVAAGYKFKQPVYVAEIDLQTVLQARQTEVLYRPLPVYPSIVRDVSLLVKRASSFAEIKRTIEQENFELLRKVEFVDVYEGKGVADDERSMTIRLEYRSDERTLLEEEVEAIHARILETLASNLDARQRF